jgi:hypothetical protein
MAILAKISTGRENVISAPLHFHLLTAIENGGISVCRGKCE